MRLLSVGALLFIWLGLAVGEDEEARLLLYKVRFRDGGGTSRPGASPVGDLVLAACSSLTVWHLSGPETNSSLNFTSLHSQQRQSRLSRTRTSSSRTCW
jgi:hypothetical protein